MSAPTPAPESDDAERTARHIRLAREMGELAMNLGRALAARTQRDLDSGVEQQSAETIKPTRRNAPDPILLFARLCKIVDNAIFLEARLAKGLVPAIPKPRPVAAAAPLPRPSLSPKAAALAASTSLATPLVTPPWQPKSAEKSQNSQNP